MSKLQIIGLAGYASVGKDTVADLLCTHHGFRKLAFADPLRAEVAQAFGTDTEDLSLPSIKNERMYHLSMRRAPSDFLASVALTVGNAGRDAQGFISDEWLDEPRSARQIMQWWGTEHRRRQAPQYWTQTMLARIAIMTGNGTPRFVITDVRFDNEAQVVRNAGGTIWQITRPGVHRDTTPEGTHASAVDGSAYQPSAVIANVHTIAHLQQVVLSAFCEMETGIAGARVVLPA